MKTQTAADLYPAISRAKTASGFTLVELLLALAIGAVIGVSVYNIFWSAIAMSVDDDVGSQIFTQQSHELIQFIF